MMQGDIVGYFGAALQEHSKAPSFLLNEFWLPQMLQKTLALSHDLRIVARDNSKKLDWSKIPSICLSSTKWITSGSMNRPKIFWSSSIFRT